MEEGSSGGAWTSLAPLSLPLPSPISDLRTLHRGRHQGRQPRHIGAVQLQHGVRVGGEPARPGQRGAHAVGARAVAGVGCHGGRGFEGDRAPRWRAQRGRRGADGWGRTAVDRRRRRTQFSDRGRRPSRQRPPRRSHPLAHAAPVPAAPPAAAAAPPSASRAMDGPGTDPMAALAAGAWRGEQNGGNGWRGSGVWG